MSDNLETGSDEVQEVDAVSVMYADSEHQEPTDEASEHVEEAELEEAETEEEADAEEASDQSEEVEEEDSEEVEIHDKPNDFAKYEYDDESKLFAFKSMGKKVKVNTETLINNFQLAQKSAKDLEAIADERKGIFNDAKTKELAALKVEADKFQELTAKLEEVIGEQDNIDWKDLEENDPTEFLIQDNLRKRRQDAKDKAGLELATQQEERRQGIVNTEAQRLLEVKGDEWKKPEDKEAAINAMWSCAETHGITQDEMSQITDHRFMLILDKAAKFDALQKKSVTNKEVKKSPPKSVKSSKAPKAEEQKAVEDIFYGT